MNITGFFIRRAVTATLITLGILAFGAISYRTLPVSDLSCVSEPVILDGQSRVTPGSPVQIVKPAAAGGGQ